MARIPERAPNPTKVTTNQYYYKLVLLYSIMLVKYSESISLQEFFESAQILKQLGVLPPEMPDNTSIRLGQVDNPAAALDIPSISKLETGKLILGLFAHPQIPLISEYDGTRNAWHHLPGTWPAAIDSIIHLRGQSMSDSLSKAEVVADVFSGSGIAGAYAANSNSNIKEVHFSDISPNAIESARLNHEFIRPGVRLEYSVGDVYDSLKKNNYDAIIVSAPPATPVYPGRDPARFNPLFQGTDKLERAITQAPEYLREGGSLILSYSSVGNEAFARACDQAGCSVKKLYEHDAAFRTEFLDGDDPALNQKWIDHLTSTGGLRPEPIKDYQFRHTIRVVEISY